MLPLSVYILKQCMDGVHHPKVGVRRRVLKHTGIKSRLPQLQEGADPVDVVLRRIAGPLVRHLDPELGGQPALLKAVLPDTSDVNMGQQIF